jgi:hypothetical protein
VEGVQERCARSPRASALRRGMGMGADVLLQVPGQAQQRPARLHAPRRELRVPQGWGAPRRGGEGLGAAICFTGFMLTVEEIGHERGPIRSIPRMRGSTTGCWRGAAASWRGSSSSGAYCSTPSETAPPGKPKLVGKM